jgi:hypothetical protein
MDENRKHWIYSLADADFDIADAFAVAITTPAAGSYRLRVDGYGSTVCTEVWYEGATIGAAGTAAVWRSVERSDSLSDASHPVLIEYAGTYTGGTVIFTKVDRDEHSMEFTLKPSTIYRVTFTSAADNNAATLQLKLSKRR